MTRDSLEADSDEERFLLAPPLEYEVILTLHVVDSERPDEARLRTQQFLRADAQFEMWLTEACEREGYTRGHLVLYEWVADSRRLLHEAHLRRESEPASPLSFGSPELSVGSGSSSPESSPEPVPVASWMGA